MMHSIRPKTPPITPRFRSTFSTTTTTNNQNELEQPFLPSSPSPSSRRAAAAATGVSAFFSFLLCRRRMPLTKRLLLVYVSTAAAAVYGVVFLAGIFGGWRSGFISSMERGGGAGGAQQESADEVLKVNTSISQDAQTGVWKWSVDIPQGLVEPLRPVVYAGVCKSVEQVGMEVRMKNSGQKEGEGGHAGHFGYYHVDEYFVDPADKEVVGKKVCEKSLTYLLEGWEAGFGVALMGLWSAYGLAKLEGRAFFVVDRDWAWGKYSSYFHPPPNPDCSPPPPHLLLPCPRHARHLLFTPATTSWNFGHQFSDHFEDPRKMGVMRQHKIFDLARVGYEGLFQHSLRDEDNGIVEERKEKLLREVVGDEDKAAAAVVAVHIRRGDKRPFEYEWSKSYLPLQRFADEARNITTNPSSSSSASASSSSATVIIQSSDDPSIYTSPSLSDFPPAQQQPQQQQPLPQPPGFTTEKFWNTSLQDRISQGRTYLRDIKILGELAAEAGERGWIVCAVSTATCRVLAVMMGWEAAVVEEAWRNVDGEFEWRGVMW